MLKQRIEGKLHVFTVFAGVSLKLQIISSFDKLEIYEHTHW